MIYFENNIFKIFFRYKDISIDILSSYICYVFHIKIYYLDLYYKIIDKVFNNM